MIACLGRESKGAFRADVVVRSGLAPWIKTQLKTAFTITGLVAASQFSLQFDMVLDRIDRLIEQRPKNLLVERFLERLIEVEGAVIRTRATSSGPDRNGKKHNKGSRDERFHNK